MYDDFEIKNAPGGLYAAQLGAERRRDVRVQRPPVELTSLHGLVCDVSEGGIGLIVDPPPEKGHRYQLTVRENGVNITECLEAEVAWCAGCRIGLRWVDVSREQEVWLRQCLRDWLQDGGRWLEVTAATVI